MRIGYFLNTYPRASHSFIRNEIRALERQGHQVHRFAVRSDGAALVDPADLEEDRLTEHMPRAHLLRVAGLWLLRHPRRALRGLRLARGARQILQVLTAAELVRRCEALGIAHVHAHFGTDPADVVMFARAMGGPGYSLTIHGPEEFEEPAALRLPEKMRAAAFTAAPSTFAQQALASLPGKPRIELVRGGIAPAEFAPTAPIALPLRLVAIGRLIDQKGFLPLIEALAVVPDVTLTLVGEGPLRPQIDAAIAEHGLAARAEVTGWVDDARFREMLDAGAALVVPSLDDGLPVAVMEAMAAGRPVIASAVGGIPELVAPNTGWLVPPGDPAALAGAIRAFAATPIPRLEEMGRTARARVIQRHDIDAEAARLAALFTGAR